MKTRKYLLAKAIFLILWISMLSSLGLAQSSYLDSLENNLKRAKDDTSRVLALVKIASYYAIIYPDSATYFGQQAIDLSLKLNYLNGVFRGYVTILFAINSTADYSKAMKRAVDNLRIAEQITDRPGPMFSALQNIGLVNFEMQNYDEAIAYFHRAISIQDTAKAFIEGAGTAYMQLATVYLKKERLNLDSALIYAKKGYELSHLKDQLGQGLALPTAVLGNAFEAINKFDSARLFYFKSLLECQQLNSIYFQGRVYNNIARLLGKIGETDSAIYYAKRSLDLCQKYHFVNYAMDASNLLMNLYQSKRMTDSVLKYMHVMLDARDTIFSQSRVRQVMQLGFAEQEHQQEIASAKATYQNRLRIYGLLGLAILFLLLLIFFYRSNRLRKKNNALLEEQKRSLEHALTDLKAAQGQLIQSEKMASLGEITAGIAHEIQNPLNFVKNFSEVTVEILAELDEHHDGHGGEIDPKISIQNAIENLKKITHHGLRADAIVKSMLQHSRSSSGKKEAVDIVRLLEEHFRINYNGRRARDNSFNITLHTNFEQDIPVINLIPEDIGIVLLNLFQNAFYSVSQKKTNLLAQGPKPNGEYLPAVILSIKRILSQEGEKKQVEIRIKDNGLGIPPTILNKIFQPFYTTKPSGQGTGLGLSLSYDIIIKEHQGTISAESMEGEWAEFIIKLPIS
ncbi:MAG: ATP-binding protein [Chitinophagales bacterium]